jgi:hypothetical protein
MASSSTPKKKRDHIDISFDDKATSPSAKVPSIPVTLRSVALFPATGDNCAVCTKKVEAGLQVLLEGEDTPIKLSHTVLEGHRICGVKGGIKKGEPLLSWGLPFGYAIRDIQPGIFLIIYINKYVLTSTKVHILYFTRYLSNSNRRVRL